MRQRYVHRFTSLALVSAAWMAGAAAAVAAVNEAPAGANGSGGHGLQIAVLSSAPSRVTGGDALIEVSGSGPDLKVVVNGADQSANFARDPTRGRSRGLAKNLKSGVNHVTASAGASKASLDLTDYPQAGPVFSGPHQTPFMCDTETFKLPDGKTLGPAQDDDCTVSVNVQFLYMPVGSEQLKPLDSNAPRPADMARTRTSAGADVPFIVRLETGVINRAIYQIGFLAEPGGAMPSPTASIPAWNGTLVYAFGGGCGVAYRQGVSTGGVVNGGEMQNDPLAAGYAVASSSLNVLGQNCNDVTSAETAMMVKEHFIEAFGPPRHTIGLGGSGGSMQQNLLTQNYPGIIDGLIPQRSFPDTHTMLISAADCPLLDHYFAGASGSWTDEQKAAVMGFPSTGHCSKAWANYLPRWVSPLPPGCNAPGLITRDERGGMVVGHAPPLTSTLYDPTKSRDGVRCGYYDNLYNVFGRNPDGSARRPLDNVGVQYGLQAFNEGRIGFEQFVDLNRNIGGFDADAGFTPRRMSGDLQAIRTAYATGRMNAGVGMNAVPIIDLRSYTDRNSATPDVHMAYTTEMARARWIAANGSADNFVAWRVPSSADSIVNDLLKSDSPSRKTMRLALATMDRWLDAIDVDASRVPAAQKVVRNKPKDVIDTCWTADMKPRAMHVNDPKDECMTMYPDHSDPRMVAGEPLVRMTIKCALQPVQPALYKAALTSAQLAMLKSVFPEGVCDYSRPGVGQKRLAGQWLSYPKAGTFRAALR